jgi:alpha-glucosidase
MNSKYFKIFAVLFFSFGYVWIAPVSADELTYQESQTIDIKLLPGEYWWGGLSVDGYRMPYDGTTELSRNLYANNQGNQASPILISSKGRYVWSEMPYRYTFAAGVLSIDESMDSVHVGEGGDSLAGAFNAVSAKYFPSNGEIPDPLLFTSASIQHLD